MISKKVIGAILLLLQSTYALAITDQITQAQDYLTQLNLNGTNDQVIAPKVEIKQGQHSILLKNYQQQNNLNETGVLDKETLMFIQTKQKELNLNVTHTLDLNTWFATFQEPDSWQNNVINQAITQWNNIVQKQIQNNTENFIVVNIPSMTLTAYHWDNVKQEASEVMTSKVIIGKNTTETPMDDFFIWGIKYHPTWTPTNNMLKKNVFKNGEINTKWLASHHIKALDSSGNVVPYSQIQSHNTLHFIQPAGNSNALGILKFETTSKENIYLHDTNERNLFSHNSRAYSSGCVRVESFFDLALWVGNMDKNTLQHKMNNNETRIEKTPYKTPVYFTYSQVLFNNNKPIFFQDIYHKDNSIIYK